MNKLIAKSILATAKVMGSSGLNIARQIVPAGVKRKLSRFVTKNATTENGFIKSKNGHLFEVIAEPVFLHLRMEGYYEKSLSDIAAKYVTENDIAVDIGANFGWYTTLFAKQVGKNGKVFSYEPNEKTYKTLRNNINANGYEKIVSAKNCGIGSERSQASLVVDEGESAIGYMDTKNVGEQSNSQKTIEIHAIDELLAEHIGKIAYVKIDVEGFEPFVMRGAKKLFSHKNAPILQLEFNVEALERQSIDSEDFALSLNELPMNIFVEHKGELIPVDNFDGRTNADLFFFPKNGLYSSRLT